MTHSNPKCETCKYRARGYGIKNGCDYILLKGHSRGCSVEECNKYVEEDRVKRIKTIAL